MKPRRALTQHDLAAIFDQAVQERALAVLSFQEGDDWIGLKARFLERDPNQRFFVLDYRPNHPDNAPELTPGQCVGVSFRNGPRKMLFSTVVEARGHYLFDDRTSIPALRFRWPEGVLELQRRSYYRTPVPETMSLVATLWRGGLAARTGPRSTTREAVTGSIADFSCGGALIRLNDAPTLSWAEQDTLGAELQLPDGRPPLLVNLCFRGFRQDAFGQRCAAVQFIGLELSVDGRLALQRLANCVQRLHRLSIASGMRDWNSG